MILSLKKYIFYHLRKHLLTYEIMSKRPQVINMEDINYVLEILDWKIVIYKIHLFISSNDKEIRRKNINKWTKRKKNHERSFLEMSTKVNVKFPNQRDEELKGHDRMPLSTLFNANYSSLVSFYPQLRIRLWKANGIKEGKCLIKPTDYRILISRNNLKKFSSHMIEF